MTGSDLIVPASREAVLALDSPTLYLLERAGEIAREILDARIVAWTAQGWTQQAIADEIGSAQRTVADRQRRLDVEPVSNRGRPRKTELAAPANSENGSGPEIADAEVVPDPPAPRRKRRRKREPQPQPPLADYLLDMLPGAEPDGAFRQTVKAWCDQERSMRAAMDATGITLVPKSDDDRQALLGRLAEVHKTAARLERQLRQ